MRDAKTVGPLRCGLGPTGNWGVLQNPVFWNVSYLTTIFCEGWGAGRGAKLLLAPCLSGACGMGEKGGGKREGVGRTAHELGWVGVVEVGDVVGEPGVFVGEGAGD